MSDFFEPPEPNTGGFSRAGDDEPKGPVMHGGGGGGGGGNWRQSFWIWPLPPPGELTLVCEWPAAGIPLTRHELDAQPILDAAQRAQVIFEAGEAESSGWTGYGQVITAQLRQKPEPPAPAMP